MAKRLDRIGDVEAKHADEERVLLLLGVRLAFLDGVPNRKTGIGWTGRCHSPARGDRDTLHPDFVASNGDIDPTCLRPGSVQRLGGATDIVATLGFGDSQRRQVGCAGDPVRQVATGEASDLDLKSAIEVDCTAAEMGENREVEIALEVGTRDEPSEQAGERDLDLSCLTERLPEHKRCA